MSIGSAVFAELSVVTNTQTDRQTYRPTDVSTYILHLCALCMRYGQIIIE